MTGQVNIFLPSFAGGLKEGLALGDQNLCLHNVDAGDLFGDRMLDLNPGVYFDKIKLFALYIHQKFNGASAFIPDMGANFTSQITNFTALGLAEIWRWGAFNDLLIASLNRAVALVKMIDVAVGISQNLHLDVSRTQDHFLEIALSIAECGLRFAAPFEHFFLEFILRVDRPHATSATTPACL